ncbi:MAG: DUF3256 family protein, partial [Tannerella sp.]|nr:DUF3256 family protein [Tannerella sp.]
MKRLIINFMMIFCGAFSATAQSMDELFAGMPDELVTQLENAWRKDLIDLYKSGKTATLDNIMQGKSTLLKLTDNYLLLQSTERTTVELRLLPLVNKTYVVCMVTTVYAPVADSHVRFYSTDWQQLPADDLFKPAAIERFLRPEADTASVAYIDAKASLDMCLVKYSLSPDSNDLTAELTTPQYLDEEAAKKAKVIVNDKPLQFIWKSG